MHFADIALQVPTVLLPRREVPLEKWAVVACDQHTSQPEYWEQVREIVAAAPSTFHLVFPEAFLEREDRPGAIGRIHATMRRYLREGVLVEQPPGLVLVERWTGHPHPRRGLVGALDLEHYDFRPGASTLIRATEGTVLERLPPRAEIRRNAPLELPHTLVLIDDPECRVIEPLCEGPGPLLYDAELMLGGGRVRGFHLGEGQAIGRARAELARLADPEVQAERYGDGGPPLLYAMGDGNHSFAAARQIWDELKQRAGGLEAVRQHPARHALVELVNVHDEGLRFEPIHRVLFGVEADEVLGRMEVFFNERGCAFSCRIFAEREAWERARQTCEPGVHSLPFATDERRGIAVLRAPRHGLEVASLQAFLDSLQEARVDYIHGEDAVEALLARPRRLAFFTRALDKGELFRTVRRDGALPRKAFSLGEAEEKRYYLECRRLFCADL